MFKKHVTYLFRRFFSNHMCFCFRRFPIVIWRMFWGCLGGTWRELKWSTWPQKNEHRKCWNYQNNFKIDVTNTKKLFKEHVTCRNVLPISLLVVHLNVLLTGALLTSLPVVAFERVTYRRVRLNSPLTCPLLLASLLLFIIQWKNKMRKKVWSFFEKT